MAKKSAFSIIGLAHKICLSAEEQGYTPELLNTLAENPSLFRQMLQVQLGHAEVIRSHVIDCDADPFLPSGWKVEEHRKGGSFVWNHNAVKLYLSDSQHDRKQIEGNKLLKLLADKPVLNANVLDYLFANKHLIPESMKKDEQGNIRHIFFWGTIYRDADGLLCVRYLFFYDGQWRWSYLWLDDVWLGYSPAALCASN